ncbi:MAG: CotH kinase family protein, partial [Verrucomicrobiales bacterium]|nr:CotH kinase family protein [Verrucomicrobiales bacterium]
AGYPTSWGGVAADYEMDADIVDHADYSDKFHDAFAALPTLSLVFDPDALFHRSTGIYQRPSSSGAAWERPTSAELIVPNGSEPGFQIDAGIRIQGGSSRNTDTPKHSLSLRFRASYGTEKLRYPLYENTPGSNSSIDRFDVLQLRPEYNFGWMHRHYYQAHHAQYGRDQWASDLYLAMGQNGSHGRWVHLFLNGIYWGLYDLHERPDANHMANYFGGSNDDYDTINSRVATNGNDRAYRNLATTASRSPQSPSTYARVQDMLDVDAFIDYMLLNAYVGNRDWDGHNWRAARKREDSAKWLFFPWDTEFAISHHGGGVFTPPDPFQSTSLNTDVTGKNNGINPTGIQSDLQRNAEYRLRYADRVRRHMFNGGPLTPERAAAIWMARATKMTTAIVAESARWGDHRRDQNPGRWRSEQFDLFTRDDHYLPTQQWVQETYLPQRTAIVLAQLRRRSLYPATDAPDFSQHGGSVPAGFALQITATATVHYTTDGSDPRLEGGNVNPAASSGTTLTLTQSTHLKARTRANNGEWSALTEATFTIAATDLEVTEIMYRPAAQPLAEFLELTNTGPLTIALTGLHFTRGIDFDFDQHSTVQTLAPGARLLLVRDLDAFHAVHGNTHDAITAGTFQNGTALSNSGETITLSDATDNVVLSVTYNDKSPWPGSADAGGRSLVFTGGDPGTAQNWRPSAADNGNPGTTGSTPFPGGDPLAYALATPPEITKTADGITLSYSVHLTADDAAITVQQSPDLTTWQTTTPELLTQILNPDNTLTLTFQLPAGTSGYLRLVATTTGN